MNTKELVPPDVRGSVRERTPSLTTDTFPLLPPPSPPPPSCQAVGRNSRDATLAPISAALQSSLREQHRESEKLGLIEMLLGAERYRSILEIGCGTGELAGRLLGRCACYTGMDDEAARLSAAARVVRDGHFLPLRLAADEPFALPAGEHELVVLSDVLPRIGTARLERLAGALAAHAACREIVIVSPLRTPGEGSGWYAERDGAAADDDEDVEHRLNLLASRIARFEHHALALRGHYRIDVLLPPDLADEPLP